MKKQKIQEVIVVEGKHDREKLLQCIDADIITSSGTHMSQEFLALCRQFHKERGLIVFTDPDGPGEMIRRRIIEEVGTTKHASLHVLQTKKKQKVGIEHADCEDIVSALQEAATFDVATESLSWHEFVDLGLTGGSNAQMRRDWLSESFKFPKSNAKTTFKYLNMMNKTVADCQAALKESTL
ncbi:ribonuclease M5 [Erysipelothrix sp. HDW6C]|uniref:ribonuclease M5 n=1 Tax=Erysipelothrix sp. HDW6C TaxID=2714930 RepID=UPI001F0F5B43|nr:ribonuclease M5 [Erysipelothrix sp. HDW6C]